MSTTNEYTLEIDETAEGEGTYFSKGHHDPAEFADALNAYIEAEYDEIRAYGPEDVEHTRWRCVPVAPWDYQPFRFWFFEGSGRGSFPVTLVRS